jgi:plasmid stability protein
MNLTIELPDELGVALQMQAQAQGVSAEGLVQRVLQQALTEGNEHLPRPKKSAYGILAQYGPGPSEAEIDENRREMFRGFAEDVP